MLTARPSMRTIARIVFSRARKDSFCHIVQFPRLWMPNQRPHRQGMTYPVEPYRILRRGAPHRTEQPQYGIPRVRLVRSPYDTMSRHGISLGSIPMRVLIVDDHLIVASG